MGKVNKIERAIKPEEMPNFLRQMADAIETGDSLNNKPIATLNISKKTMNTNNMCAENIKVDPEISDEDLEIFFKVMSTELADWQIQQIITPSNIYPKQKQILAVHWHPEFVPMNLVSQRIEAMFPNCKDEMLIPTQHNELMSYGRYTGVEVDCYASGFNQKVQLLLHFENEKIEKAHVLKSMLAHTFKYRSSQLFEFMDSITKPIEKRVHEAARKTGADKNLVEMVKIYVTKIQTMLEDNWSDISKASIKNKLLKNYFDAMRPKYGDTLINRAQAYLKAIKSQVKTDFSLKFFYRATEIIEETHGLGGCVVIPHPEEFWPILLAKYDVDGIEAWNPQSQRYTDFLISVINEQNANRASGSKEVFIFMGDDCHMSEKTKPVCTQDPVKAAREIGLQPAWDDLNIRKKLIMAGIDRQSIIKDYKARLAG